MSIPSSQLGKRFAPGHATRHEVKRQRTWADKVVEKQSANGVEDDQHRVSQRQKQIDLGKDTLAYDSYVNAVPLRLRKPQHPMTPLATQRCSRRSFVGQMKRWRKMLFDFTADAGAATAELCNDEKHLSSRPNSVGVPSVMSAETEVMSGELAFSKSNGGCNQAASPPVACTSIGSGAGTPSGVDDLSDYEEDDGIVLDDMGNLVSIEPVREANTAPDSSELPAEAGEAGISQQEPAKSSIFDVF